MGVVGDRGVQMPVLGFAERQRGGEPTARIGPERLPNLLGQFAVAPVAILGLAQELNGINPREHCIRIVAVNRLEAIEILQRVSGIQAIPLGLVRVAGNIRDVRGVHVHAPQRLKKRDVCERRPLGRRAADPATADVERLSFDPQAGPQGSRLAVIAAQPYLDDRICQRQTSSCDAGPAELRRFHAAPVGEGADLVAEPGTGI